MSERREVVVIGAGPAGSIAAALLAQRHRDVLVLERQRFPRFAIGESLLVHCLDFVEEAGMLAAVDAAGFQYKNGAAFARGSEYGDFDFSETFTPAGRVSTYEVERAVFDQLLAREAQRQGAEIRFESQILNVEFGAGAPAATAPRVSLTARGPDGALTTIGADFVLDASGFGRTLPRMLGLERPSNFPVRQALFTHVLDRVPAGAFDRNKILITVHARQRDLWYWLIPLAGGRSSIGVVGEPARLEAGAGDAAQRLRRLVSEDARLADLLAAADWDTPVRTLGGYAANVTTMHGPGFALLGNAAQFLDPVFSSGVTIAMRSASLAAAALERQLAGSSVDWDREFERPLRVGIDCFGEFVNAWYDGRLHDIFFSANRAPQIRRMICSVLAGYAWDARNPFVSHPRRRLDVLAQLCAAQRGGQRS